MKLLLITAAMWCSVAATAQNNPPDYFHAPAAPYFNESSTLASMNGMTLEEYEIEIDRLPKLAVFTDSQEGFEKIVADYPTARQINVLNAQGEPIYRYLPSQWDVPMQIPDWPKGIYLIELFLESERKISSQRLVIL